MMKHVNGSMRTQHEHDRLRAEIRKGLDDLEAGRAVDGDAAFKALRHALSS